jgi:hypothetical protein
VAQPAVVESASRRADNPLNDPVAVLAAKRDWKRTF